MSYENPDVPHEVNVGREDPLVEFVRLLAGIALCNMAADPDAEALVAAIHDVARLNARRLDQCATIIRGGPCVGCFADDLAND